jgi:hypothetical protein
VGPDSSTRCSDRSIERLGTTISGVKRDAFDLDCPAGIRGDGRRLWSRWRSHSRAFQWRRSRIIFILRSTYRLFVTGISLLIIVAIVTALQVERDPTGRQLLMGVAALGLGLAVAVWCRNIVAVYVQIIALPALGALYLFELGRVDPIDQMLHVEQRLGIVKARKAAGKPVSMEHSPANLVGQKSSLALADGSRVLPLSSVANVPTIMCREGPRPVAEYVADEHGYNNPKGRWGTPIDLVFIGRSASATQRYSTSVTVVLGPSSTSR